MVSFLNAPLSTLGIFTRHMLQSRFLLILHISGNLVRLGCITGTLIFIFFFLFFFPSITVTVAIVYSCTLLLIYCFELNHNAWLHPLGGLDYTFNRSTAFYLN